MYAEILDVTPLSLNAHFRAQDSVDSSTSQHLATKLVKESTEESLDINSTLFADINRAAGQAFSGIFVANKMQRQEGRLYIPSATLSSAQKRQLWALISG
ncbi:hypothetical protein [Pseudoalteromonas sp. S16_S37]|uniref:hypothetical protein n=1 Tax=Pseudoalteromonas sp. S16_S37 TaxID=2720228 RepID=UPI001680237B|nr:hypothetical protein [Pseudoalteromonas sp. S16_S37]MBD1581805.1 hypothetical protein [Pseudoalteromonas sp. S16_S37]